MLMNDDIVKKIACNLMLPNIPENWDYEERTKNFTNGNTDSFEILILIYYEIINMIHGSDFNFDIQSKCEKFFNEECSKFNVSVNDMGCIVSVIAYSAAHHMNEINSLKNKLSASNNIIDKYKNKYPEGIAKQSLNFGKVQLDSGVNGEAFILWHVVRNANHSRPVNKFKLMCHVIFQKNSNNATIQFQLDLAHCDREKLGIDDGHIQERMVNELNSMLHCNSESKFVICNDVE